MKLMIISSCCIIVIGVNVPGVYSSNTNACLRN